MSDFISEFYHIFLFEPLSSVIVRTAKCRVVMEHLSPCPIVARIVLNEAHQRLCWHSVLITIPLYKHVNYRLILELTLP